MTAQTIAGFSIQSLETMGSPVAREDDINILVGDLMGVYADIILVPVARLAAPFFDLKTGLAGALMQKCANYQLRIAIIGDISAHLTTSQALTAMVAEANRGKHIMFVNDLDALTELLA